MLERFRVLRVPELKAFIVAHDDELLRMKDIPNKGTVKEAMEHGVHNSIMVAYEYREKPNLLEGEHTHSAEDLAKFAEGDNDDKGSSDIAVST